MSFASCSWPRIAQRRAHFEANTADYLWQCDRVSGASAMRRRLVKEKPAGNVSVERLPEVVPPAPAADERPISPGASGVSARLRPPTSLPSPLFSSAALANNADNKR